MEQEASPPVDLVAKYLPKLDVSAYSRWLTNGCYLDAEAAARVVEFAHEELVQTMGKWAGQKVQLLDWQIYEFIVPVFGIKTADGKRRFTRAYVEIPRKNGKSTLAALLILYLLGCDQEVRPFVYGYAVDEKQAKICLDEAIAYVDASHYLKDEVFITYKDKIECPGNGGKYVVLSKGAENKDGLNAHAAVCDEMHQLKDAAIIDRVHRSSSTREQPLEIFITTAGIFSAGKQSVCWKYHEKAEKCRDNPDYDPTFFGLIYGISAEEYEKNPDIWKDPEAWKRANPSLGYVKSYKYMEDEARNAEQNPSDLNDFLRFELNIWVGSAVTWIPAHILRAKAIPVSLEQFYGRKCFAGLDLSRTRDYTALTLCFTPFELDKFYTLWPFLWCPGQTIEQRAKEQPVLKQWIKDDWVIETEGDVVDYKAIKAKIEWVRKMFRCEEIAFDSWNSSMLVQELQDEGAPMVEFRQGFKTMSPVINDFDIQMGENGLIRLNGNPCMEWMYGNVILVKDSAFNKKPDKDKSSDCIDGPVSGLMAFGRAFQPQTKNPLEERGIRSLND